MTPGDVVITEVHANPDGPDGDGEYIELFNASGATLSLDGLTLVASKADGTGQKAHRFISGSIDPGDYFVVGNASRDSMPPYLDDSYGDTLGSLRNSDGVLSIRCGEAPIDQMRYERTVDGRALELDGRLEPDHELNDDTSRWCVAPQGSDEFSAGNFGTPGTSNSPCEPIQLDGMCLQAGTGRAIRAPEPGEVRISEWMANPAGPDADFEWVEVFFEANADLNGLQLGPSADALQAVIDQQACFPVDAGTRVVFGASPAAAPRVDAGLVFSLRNSGMQSIVAGAHGLVLDRVDYDGTTEGVAWQVDPDQERCPAPSSLEYATDNYGTPGEANPSCPPVLSPGMCFDQGKARGIVSPKTGEAHITEWMANPSAVGNRDGEWLEVQFDAAVDLNGLVLSDLTSSVTTVEDEDCLQVPAGARVVFARNLDPSENGGVEGADAKLSLSLNNSEETLTLSVGALLLDSVTYEHSKAGVAIQVDELGRVCDAMHAYGDGDLGTPGSANPPCS